MKRVIFGHVPNPSPHFIRLKEDVETRHANRSRAGRNETGKNSQDRAFSCSVWAKQAHNFTPADLERHPIYSGVLRIPFGQLTHFDHRSGHREIPFSPLLQNCATKIYRSFKSTSAR